MKRWGYTMVFYLAMCVGLAQADSTTASEPAPEEPTVTVEEPLDKPALVNEPEVAAKQATDVVDVLEPTVELIFNFETDEWTSGVSGSLYDFTSENVLLGRVKTGYLSSNALYGGLDVDLPGMVDRYMNGGWPQLEKILTSVAEYARVGYIVGYDLEADELVHGPSFGASLRF